MNESDFQVSAIVLAAGRSRRMGQPKLGLPFGKSTMVGEVVGKVANASTSITSVTVVLGYYSDIVREALAGLSVNFAVNRKPDMGMLSSVQTGLKAAGEAGGYLICLGDQPDISAEVIKALINSAGQTEKGFFLPVHEGKRGHPLLIKARYVPEILGLPLTVKLNELLDIHADEVMEVPVDDPSVSEDIDTPEDDERLRS
jgi:molybdenum cofactor cytidylyltransferase